MEKIFISLPVCNTLFVSHSASKVFISLSENVFFLGTKLDPELG